MSLSKVKISAEAVSAIQAKMIAVEIAQKELNSYLAGYMQGLGLEGSWNLNTTTWIFEKTKEVKK